MGLCGTAVEPGFAVRGVYCGIDWVILGVDRQSSDNMGYFGHLG